MASEVRVPEDGSLPRLTPRMPVKMEMEPQKVALEDEDLRFSRFFLLGNFLVVHFLDIKIVKNIWKDVFYIQIF